MISTTTVPPSEASRMDRTDFPVRSARALILVLLLASLASNCYAQGTAAPSGATIGVGGGGGGTGDSSYLDSALPQSLFRFRLDAGYGMNRPDRAEFFYSQYRSQPFASDVSGGGTNGNRGPG